MFSEPYIIDFSLILLGAMFGLLVNFLIQNISYKNDYYKLLIAKRINTYEKIDNLLSHLRKTYNIKGNIYIHCVFNDRKSYLLFTEELSQILANPFWIDLNTYELLQNLSEIVQLGININSDLELKKSATNNFQNIHLLYTQLTNSLYANFKELHKVKKFIKSIQNQRYNNRKP